MGNFKDLKDLEIAELKGRLKKTNSAPCSFCVNTSETIDSIEYQVERQEKLIADLERELNFIKKFRGFSL